MAVRRICIKTHRSPEKPSVRLRQKAREQLPHRVNIGLSYTAIHRLRIGGFTLVMEGYLDPFIDALTAHYQAEKLKADAETAEQPVEV